MEGDQLLHARVGEIGDGNVHPDNSPLRNAAMSARLTSRAT
jgi:hypothetical protein